MEKRKWAKKQVSILMAVVMFLSAFLGIGMEPKTVYATEISNQSVKIVTDPKTNTITSVTYAFEAYDAATFGIWYLYLWEKGDTSGEEGRPQILAETSKTTDDGGIEITLDCAGKVTLGKDYMVGMVLKDTRWSTGDTTSEELKEWPYLTGICDAVSMDDISTVYYNGELTKESLSEIFKYGSDHTWFCETVGNAFVVKCSDEECTYAENGIAFTVTAENAEATGYAYDEAAYLSLSGSNGSKEKINQLPIVEKPIECSYYLEDGVTRTNTENSGAKSEGAAPSKAGTYVLKAEIASEESNFVTEGCKFSILPAPEYRNVNLNVKQTDGSYAMAGITDPGNPMNSRFDESAEDSSWGVQKDSEGNIIKSGSYIYYGTYQQGKDEDASKEEASVYKTEPIKWRVLDADTIAYDADTEEAEKKTHTMFLLADRALDTQKFNAAYEQGEDHWYYKKENDVLTSYKANDYLHSDLRSWLNGTFIENAFTKAEKQGIAESSKAAEDETIDDYSKDNTGLSKDKVFALSVGELRTVAYGFLQPDSVWSNNGSTKMYATDYAKGKGSYQNAYWWLRSAYRLSIDVYSDNQSCIKGGGEHNYYRVTNSDISVVPAWNLELSSVAFASESGTAKASDFESTSVSKAKEWNLTITGGEGFTASMTEIPVNNREVKIDFGSIGTANEGVEYNQISAMLVDTEQKVLAYGKIAESDAESAVFEIPQEIPDGSYTLKVFAEDVNSTEEANLTDYISNMEEFIVVVGGYRFEAKNPEGTHITRAAESGEEKQRVLKGNKITSVVYTADEGYFFPEDYTVEEVNGIKVTRDSKSQITVSGILTTDTEITLKAATEKPYFTVSFDSAGGSEVKPQTVQEDKQAEKPADPTKTEHIFLDWYLGDEVYDFTAPITGNVELTAKWQINAYDLKVVNPSESHMSHKETSGSEEQTVDYGNAITSIVYTADEGYFFPEDYTVEEVNGIKVTRDSKSQITVSGILTTDTEITLKAATEKPYFTVSFDSAGGSEVKPQTVQEDKQAEKPADPTKTGYSFVDWYVGDKAYDFALSITGEVKLTAKWNAVLVKEIKITGISKKIAAGKKIQLSVEAVPFDAADRSVTWSSSNTKYAEVSANGLVTLKKAGKGKSVKITATAKDGSGKTAVYQIKIMKNAVKKIALKAKKTTVKAGQSVKIKASVTPKKGVNKTLLWVSSNPEYAEVSAKGVVTTKKAGKGKKVTITARAMDGSGKKKTLKIKIK